MNEKIVVGGILIASLLALGVYDLLRRTCHWSVVRRAHNRLVSVIELFLMTAFLYEIRIRSPWDFAVPGLFFVGAAGLWVYEALAGIWSFHVHDAPRDRLEEMNRVVCRQLLPTEEALVEDEDVGLPVLRIRRVDRSKARTIVGDLEEYLEEHPGVRRFQTLRTTAPLLADAVLIAFVVYEMLR